MFYKTVKRQKLQKNTLVQKNIVSKQVDGRARGGWCVPLLRSVQECVGWRKVAVPGPGGVNL